MKKILGRIIATTLLSLIVVQQSGFAMGKQKTTEKQSGNKTSKQKDGFNFFGIDLTPDTIDEELALKVEALSKRYKESNSKKSQHLQERKQIITERIINFLKDQFDEMSKKEAIAEALPRMLAAANKRFEQESTTERTRLAEIEKTLLELEQKIQTRNVCNKIKQLSEEKAFLESNLKERKEKKEIAACQAWGMMVKNMS